MTLDLGTYAQFSETWAHYGALYAFGGATT
jgi:hypothetical protein